MSEAPRTEKHCICGGNKALCIDCLFELSCQLESELADKDQQLAEARAEIKRLKKNLRLLLCKKHLDECENGLFNSRFPDDEPCLICVVEAAERGE